MKKLIKTIKGILLGFILIIPGVSGTTIAVTLNMYDDLITALSNVIKKPISSVKSIWEYGLGMCIGLALSVVFVATVYVRFPIQLTALFIGLIIGGIPKVIKDSKIKFNKAKDYIIIICSMVLVGSLLFIPIPSNDTNSNNNLVLYLLIGFLIAGPVIIPGLSGAVILSMMGYYNQTMTTIKDFMKYFFTFEFTLMFNNMIPVILMGIGGVLGLVLFAKGVKYILDNYPNFFNSVILGVLIIAPLSIIMSLDKELSTTGSSLKAIISTGNLIVAAILLIIGLVLSLKASSIKIEENNQHEQVLEGDSNENT